MINIVFTGGGTGGHIFPGLAVAEELRSLLSAQHNRDEYKIVWIGNKSGMDKSLVEKSGVIDEFVGIPCGKFRRYFSLKNFFDLFKIIAGFISSFFKLAKLKPKVVFSKGGFVSVPPCYAAKMLKIPVFTHECDFTCGLATKLNTKVAKNLFVSYRETKEKLPQVLQNKTIVSGNPVRPAFFSADKKSGWKFVSGTENFPEQKVLLVVGGSLGAKQINDLVMNNIDWLCANFIVIHQTGKQDDLAEFSHKNYYRFEFIYEKMCDVMMLCDIIFSRAGANFLWEAMSQLKPMLLLPLGGSGSRGDQIDNAEYFAGKGCAVVLDSQNVTDDDVRSKLTEMSDESVRQKMSLACKNLLGTERASLIIAKTLLNETV